MRQGSSPKCPATSDNPSVGLWPTAPFAQGSLRDGGCGLPRRFAPRNDSPDPSSFRGGPTGRRGNPSFFTMDGGAGRRGRRPLREVYRSPSNGPMYLRHGFRRPNFVPKFGASVMGIGPYAPRSRGMGGNRRKDHPKRGTAPRLPGQRLAKRKARKEQLVKFGLCPMTSECSTAHKVRKSEQGPARAPAGAIGSLGRTV